MASNLSPPTQSLDDKLKFEIEHATSSLEQISKKLDKNLNLQFIFSFIALLFVFDSEILKQSITMSPLGINVSAEYFRILMPVILLKLFMDWCIHSYEYITVRHHVGKLLEEFAMQDKWELIVPPSAYKYIYHTESKGNTLALKITHFWFSAVILTLVSFNVGLVSYYGCNFFGCPLQKIVILVGIALVYGVYYLVNFKALRDTISVWWYKQYLGILAVCNLIAIFIAAYHCR